MARYEIDIPPSPTTGFQIRAQVQADTWSEALRLSLGKLEGIGSVQSLIVDILDDQHMRVTEPVSQRTYVLRQLVEATQHAAPALPQAPIHAPATVAAPDPGAEFAAFLTPPPPPPDAGDSAASMPAPVPLVAKQPPSVAPSVVPAVAVAIPTPAPVGRPQGLPATPGIPGFAPVAAAPSPLAEQASVPSAATPAGLSEARRGPRDTGLEEVLSVLFERCQDVYQRARGVEDAAEFFMELALEHVPSEAGAVFISELDRNDIYFAAARGPRAAEVKQLKMPLGQGFIGFAVENGVGIAVSDTERDPRAKDTMAARIGFSMRSLICAPAQKDGRVFGGIEVFNKKSGTRFEANELEIMNYLGDRFAEYLDQHYGQRS